jgi:Protein of unknown function (DUF1091)
MKLFKVLAFASCIGFAVSKAIFNLKMFDFNFISIQWSQLYYFSSVYNYNKDYVSNGSFAVFNDSEGLSRSNVTAFFRQEVKNMVVVYTIRLRTTGREYDRLLHKGTIDACNVVKGVLGNMIIKYITENLDSSTSNYKFQCPQPAGMVYCYNFPIFNIKNLPKFIVLGAREEWEFTAIFRGKYAGLKRMVKVMSLKTLGVAIL